MALVASAGTITPPPPVLNGKQFEEVVNGVTEPDVLNDLENLPYVAQAGGVSHSATSQAANGRIALCARDQQQ